MNLSEVICKCFTSGEELCDKYGESKFDVIFLDIVMKGLNGIEVGKRIREIDDRVILVYLTGFADFALEAFELNSFHYLIKPITKNSFNNLFEKILVRLEEIRALENKNKVLSFKTKDCIFQVRYEEIYYLEKNGRKIILYTEDNAYDFYGSLKKLLLELPQDIFLQCHQGYAVNMTKVREMEVDEIQFIKIKNKVPVSRRYKCKVTDRLKTY